MVYRIAILKHLPRARYKGKAYIVPSTYTNKRYVFYSIDVPNKSDITNKLGSIFNPQDNREILFSRGVLNNGPVQPREHNLKIYRRESLQSTL